MRDLSYDMHIYLTTIMTIVFFVLNNRVPDMHDLGKFTGHLVFLSLVLHMIFDGMSVIYDTIFYFGFVNTVVYSQIMMFILMGGVSTFCGAFLEDRLSSSNLGRTLLSTLNYCYNTYILPIKLSDYLFRGVCYLYEHYLSVYGMAIYRILKQTNTDFCDNTKSQMIINKMDEKYTDIKQALFKKYLQQSMFGAMNSTMGQDPFNFSKSLKLSHINPQINTEMNFLKESQVEDIEDDLDDSTEEIESVTPPEPTQETPEKNDPIDNAQKAVEEAQRAQVERQKMLKRKIAAKKAGRTGGRSNQAAQQQVSNMMSMPGMDKIMEEMMKGDNLKNIMQQFPQDKMNGDPEQMKKMLKSMSKK